MQTAQEFYGAAYNRATDTAKLDTAFKQLNMAINASSESVQERAMELACRNEEAAFAHK